MIKKTYRVPDMMCVNCAMHLEALEDELPGVRRVTASFKKQIMEIEYDETRLSEESIMAAVAEMGYHPEPN